MRESIKESLRETIQGIVDLGEDTLFTKKELNELGIKFSEINMPPERIQKIRSSYKISQSVFANLMNVSLSTVRQWEIGVRQPTGATKVLLEIMEREPQIINYRLNQ